jgi:hypothetical protein
MAIDEDLLQSVVEEVLGPLKSTISANYTLHNHQLDVVDSSKYLGVTINKNLRWDDHINNITARANLPDCLSV